MKFIDVLREFSVRYLQEDGPEVTPSTMLGYIRGSNGVLKLNNYPINLLDDSLFTEKKFGFIPVLDNRFAEQQSNRAIVKHHRTLPREELVTILDNAICDPRNSLGYVSRYII